MSGMRAAWSIPLPAALVACASAAAAGDAEPTPILVQVLRPGADPFDADAWSPPLDRHPRVVAARLGQVIVAGIWTVRFELAAEDGAWLDGLSREHGEYRMTWDGLVLNGGRTGYIMHMQGKSHAERVLASPPWSTAAGAAR
jgi:hypothetical protein